MAKSKIDWCDAVWNPTIGCEKVSEGCRHCYAERMAARLAAMGNAEYQDVVTPSRRWNGHVKCLPGRLNDPLEWKRPRRIFVNSMSDLFHLEVNCGFIQDVWEVMRRCTWHTFIILTKRPAIMCKMVNVIGPTLPNVWLGVSVEDQKTADERIPWLLKTPAAVRVVSVEPMIDSVDISQWNYRVEDKYNLLSSLYSPIDWVICGGESGPDAQPVHVDWIRSLLDQCLTTNIPFFFKQWGEWAPLGVDNFQDVPKRRDGRSVARLNFPGWDEKWMIRVGKKVSGRELDGRIWEEYPE
jgi:protein gp37